VAARKLHEKRVAAAAKEQAKTAPPLAPRSRQLRLSSTGAGVNGVAGGLISMARKSKDKGKAKTKPPKKLSKKSS
jgi:hypothetical protein